MDVFCGIDWTEGHHEGALVDDTGKLLAKCRINDDPDDYRLLLDLLDLLAGHGYLVLADIIRTDAPVHRPLPADTDLAQAVAVPVRAQQDAVRNRQQVPNQLRSLLREHFRR